MRLNPVEPLGFFDFASYLVPGLVAMTAILLGGCIPIPNSDAPYGSIVILALLAAGSYVLGHLVHPLADLGLRRLVRALVGDPRVYVLGASYNTAPLACMRTSAYEVSPDHQGRLLTLVRDYLGLEPSKSERMTKDEIRHAYYICETLVVQQSPEVASRAYRSVAISNLTRSLALALVFLGLVLLLGAAADQAPDLKPWLGALCLAGATVGLVRFHRSDTAARRQIYDAFFVLRRRSLTQEHQEGVSVPERRALALKALSSIRGESCVERLLLWLLRTLYVCGQQSESTQ
jgi:hypothetical protein